MSNRTTTAIEPIPVPRHIDTRTRWKRGHIARWCGIAAVGLTATGCCTAAPQAEAVATQASPDAIALTDDGKRYLKYVYQIECAEDYLIYPDGEGPPVPERTPSEWQEREAELTRCLEERVLGQYTNLEMVRTMMWDGEKYEMSNGAMTAIVRFGDEFLDGYVSELLEGERQRAGRPAERAAQRTGEDLESPAR